MEATVRTYTWDDWLTNRKREQGTVFTFTLVDRTSYHRNPWHLRWAVEQFRSRPARMWKELP